MRVRKKPRERKACEYCGELFWAKRKDTQFCSKDCKNKSYYERKREEILSRYRQSRMDLISHRVRISRCNIVKREFDHIIDISCKTKLSYGYVRAFYPDMKRIYFLANYKKIINEVI